MKKLKIENLREICQLSREKKYGKENIADRILRIPSIYFTWLFLNMGFSANQVTMVSLVIGIIGALLCNFNLLFGLILVYLYAIIDASDGEVARYNKTSSPKGLFLDYMAYIIVFTLLLLSLPLDMYTGIFCIAGLIGFFWFEISILSNYKIFIDWRLKYKDESKKILKKQEWYISLILQSVGYVEFITITLILTIFTIPIDIYVIYFGITKFSIACYNWYHEYKYGLERI